MTSRKIKIAEIDPAEEERRKTTLQEIERLETEK
jgi:hypothetical protein